VPPDLLVIDLASVYPELANLRLRGKLQGRRVVPYRAVVTSRPATRWAGNEIVWVDDPGRGILPAGAGLRASALR